VPWMLFAGLRARLEQFQSSHGALASNGVAGPRMGRLSYVGTGPAGTG